MYPLSRSGLLALLLALGCAPQEGPGIYTADPYEGRNCDEVCVGQMLVCDDRHAWPTLFGSTQGGGRQEFEQGRTSIRGVLSCDDAPEETTEFMGETLDAAEFECACIEPRGWLVDESLVSIATDGVFQGPFALAEPLEVTYAISDNFRITPNRWRVAIVPAASVEAFVSGESAMTYGGFDGQGSHSASATLPAGDYALVVDCENLGSPCSFDASVIATDGDDTAP